MDGYKPPFTITNSILSHVASVSEKVGRITAVSYTHLDVYKRQEVAEKVVPTFAIT